MLAMATAVVGCQSILHFNDEDAQQIVDKHAVGVSAGDFFERYGKPRAREEHQDGTLEFIWDGGVVEMAAGVRGLEDKICSLRISTDKRGRIVSAPIVRDAKGERRLSRCAELFDR
jgi:hypothetical protein